MMKSLVAGLLALSMLPPALAQDAPRTFLDTLALDDPEASAETFIDRHRARDYFAVYFTFSGDARQDFVKRVGFSNFVSFFPGMEGIELPGSVYLNSDSTDRRLEMYTDLALVFDDLMLAAEGQGWLPFTFGPDAEVVDVNVGHDLATAVVATDAEPEEIVLELVRNDTGQWRVDRVRWEGSGTARPWGMEIE